MDKADQTSLTKKEAEEAIKTAVEKLQDPAFTKDGYIVQFKKILEQYTPTTTAYGHGRAFGSKLGSGEN